MEGIRSNQLGTKKRTIGGVFANVLIPSVINWTVNCG